MPRERTLRDYLFENPEVLFPNQLIDAKHREFYIEGRFIDFLFEVDGVQYIIELKRDTIRRETIGQIFEYYGLMRRSQKTANFKMILVAPHIPDFRRIPLEEFGIRCVEIPLPSDSIEKQGGLTRLLKENSTRDQERPLSEAPASILTRLAFSDLQPPVSRTSLAITHTLLRDGLSSIVRDFFEYEIRPVKMMNSNQPDVLCFPQKGVDGPGTFTRGGAWWAFSFGHSETMPKNDVPNISVNTLPWGLDFAINAELRSSQEVMLRKIASSTTLFNQLVTSHGGLSLQGWLKLEHQPRFYHWIPLIQKAEGSWQGEDILRLYRRSADEFGVLRENWISWIKRYRKELTTAQMLQMDRTNQKLNLALRLVYSFRKEDQVWSFPYDQQTLLFRDAYRRLKPLVDFFQ